MISILRDAKIEFTDDEGNKFTATVVVVSMVTSTNMIDISSIGDSWSEFASGLAEHTMEIKLNSLEISNQSDNSKKKIPEKKTIERLLRRINQ